MMICCVFNLFYRAIKSVEELKNGTELHNTHRIVGQYMYFVHKISALLAIHTILKRFVPRKATCGSAPIRSTWSQRRPVVSRWCGPRSKIFVCATSRCKTLRSYSRFGEKRPTAKGGSGGDGFCRRSSRATVTTWLLRHHAMVLWKTSSSQRTLPTCVPFHGSMMPAEHCYVSHPVGVIVSGRGYMCWK